MTASEVDFDEQLSVDFVDELFKACLQTNDKHLIQTVLDVVKENFLPDEAQRDFYKELKIQFKVEQKMPTFGTMQLAFAGKRNKLNYLHSIKEVNDLDAPTLVKTLEHFVKQSRFIQLYDEVGELYNKGNRKKAISHWITGSEEVSGFSLQTKQLTKVFGDFNQRNSKRIAERDSDANVHIPTGIHRLDSVMHGGPVPGDLVCWLGDSKAGKSFALSQCGLTAARLGYPTLHVQAEDTEAKCTNRYDSAWMGVTYYDVIDGEIPDKVYKSYQRIVKGVGKGEIYVHAPEKFGAITISEIRTLILDLRKQGVDIKVLVVDYWDLINPDGEQYKPSEERFRQQKVGQMLKEMALEFNIVVHTATQASSIDAELVNDENFVLTRQYLAEDKGKIRPVNALITINFTQNEKKLNIRRLFVEASRDNESSQVIKIKTNLARSRFYDHKATLKMYDEELSDEVEE